MGFAQGAASPCVFSHAVRGVIVSVHGDDFTAAGLKCELDWFEQQMRARYELTVGGRLGPGPEDDKEATVLKIIIKAYHMVEELVNNFLLHIHLLTIAEAITTMRLQ